MTPMKAEMLEIILPEESIICTSTTDRDEAYSAAQIADCAIEYAVMAHDGFAL